MRVATARVGSLQRLWRLGGAAEREDVQFGLAHADCDGLVAAVISELKPRESTHSGQRVASGGLGAAGRSPPLSTLGFAQCGAGEAARKIGSN